jgi:hypothetical protein
MSIRYKSDRGLTYILVDDFSEVENIECLNCHKVGEYELLPAYTKDDDLIENMRAATCVCGAMFPVVKEVSSQI